MKLCYELDDHEEYIDTLENITALQLRVHY